jgi:coatomer subunit beta
MDLVSPRNVEEVMALLKKEIVVAQAAAKADSTSSADSEDARYRAMLISAIHGCAVRFPEVANNVVHLLMDFLAGDGALPVIEFVREIVEVRRGAWERRWWCCCAPPSVLFHAPAPSVWCCQLFLAPHHPMTFTQPHPQTYPEMRRGVLSKLRDVISDVSSSDVFRVALWLLGQYSESDEEVQAALRTARECLGPLPLTMPWEQFISQVGAPRE